MDEDEVGEMDERFIIGNLERGLWISPFGSHQYVAQFVSPESATFWESKEEAEKAFNALTDQQREGLSVHRLVWRPEITPV